MKRYKKGGTFTIQSSNRYKISVCHPEGYETNEMQMHRCEISTEGAYDSLVMA